MRASGGAHRVRTNIRFVCVEPLPKIEPAIASSMTCTGQRFRTFSDQDPVALATPLAKTAVQILATDQLNGSLDEVNGIVESEVMDWDGTNWTDAYTSNPASLFRHVLQGPGRANPVT